MAIGVSTDWGSPAYDGDYELRREIIAQRKEIISLLRSLGAELTQGAPVSDYPKWIRDRLTALGEDI